MAELKHKYVSYRGFHIEYIHQMNVWLIIRVLENGGRNQKNYLGEFKTLEEAKKWIRKTYY
jgi:hypothetical protein